MIQYDFNVWGNMAKINDINYVWFMVFILDDCIEINMYILYTCCVTYTDFFIKCSVVFLIICYYMTINVIIIY